MNRLAFYLGAALAALTLAVPGAAAAQDDDGFQPALDEALAHYEARRYEEAAAAFQAAYEIRQEPELMYNIARSYERALRREEAVAAYGRFLELPGTTSEMRTRARTARDSLQAEIDAMNAPPEPDPPPEPEDTQPRRSAGGGGGGETTDDDGGGMDLAPVGWVLVGLGGAGVIVGSIFGGLALSSNDDFEAATDRAEQERLQDEVNRYALLTDILLFAGGAVAVAGIVFLVVDAASGGDDASEAGLRVVPTVGPDHAGVSLLGSF